MCRHCDHLSDPNEKRVVHEFMEVAAKKLSSMHPKMKLIKPDDIEVELHTKAIPKCRPYNPFTDNPEIAGRVARIFEALGSPGDGGI